MFILDVCDNISIVSIIYFISTIIGILCVVTSVLLLLVLTIDFVRAVMESDSEKMDKVKKTAVKRIVYAVIVFLVPAIVNGTMSLLGDSTSFTACYDLATSGNVERLAEIKRIDDELKTVKYESDKKELIKKREDLYKQINENRRKDLISVSGGGSSGGASGYFPNQYIQAKGYADAAGASDCSGGGYTNCTLGDQSGKEVLTHKWTSGIGSWDVILRSNDPVKANKAASCMEAAAANDNIGYGQKGSSPYYMLWDYLEERGNWDVSTVNKKISVSCCPLVAVCMKYAGFNPTRELDCQPNKTGKKAAVQDAGSFTEIDSRNLSEIRRGDVLIKHYNHMAMAI